MRLLEYLKSNDISCAEFARQIGAKSRATVHRYITNTRKIPSRDMMENIIKVTGGAVTIIDFYDTPKKHKPSKKVNTKNPI